MTSAQADASIRQLYWLTICFGVAGFLFYSAARGFYVASAFILGVAVSLGNLWLFSYLGRVIAPPEAENKPANKAWGARAFISRYLLLFAGGYAITRALDTEPLPVVFGLFSSTAAVLVSSIIQIFRPTS